MAITGKQRSLTVTIDKTIAGVQVDGYPHTYQGRNTFTVGGTTYPAIDATQMALLPIEVYEARLEDFESYVESLEVGLDMSADVVSGSEAYRVNTTACPIV